MGDSGGIAIRADDNAMITGAGATSPFWETADAGASWQPITVIAPPVIPTVYPAPYVAADTITADFLSDSAIGLAAVVGGTGSFFGINRQSTEFWRGSGPRLDPPIRLSDPDRDTRPWQVTAGKNGDAIVAVAKGTTFGAPADEHVVVIAADGSVSDPGGDYTVTTFHQTFHIDTLGDGATLLAQDMSIYGASGLWISPEYRTIPLAPADASIGGGWITGALGAAYLGGRTGLLKVDNLGSAPASRVVVGDTESIGYVRADRQTRTTAAARIGYTTDTYLSADGEQWARIAGPPNVLPVALADWVEVTAARPIGPVLAVSVDAPMKLDIANGQYTPNPFTVVATVRNQGTDPATDVQLTLTLPTGLTLVADAPLMGIGQLPPGESRQVQWQVNAAAQGQETTLAYAIAASASNAPSQTGTRQITIPPLPFTTSYYMRTTDTKATRSLGCLARRDRVEGIVVLAFGHPRNLGTDANPIYGTQFTRSERKVQLSEIATAVKAFAQGYIEGCDPETYPRPSPANLIIAIGTDNSKVLVDVENDIWQDNPGLTRAHGEAWAQMVNQVNDWLKQQGYYGGVQAAGGYDAEFGAQVWASSGTFDWAEGYDSKATAFYYNYGACESCPRAQPRAEWSDSPNSTDPNGLHSFAHVQSADRVFRISWKILHALPLPQIYLKAYAQEWYNVRRYAREQGRNMIIQGVMTECQSSGCDTSDTRPWMDFSAVSDLPPRQGWQALYDTLNASFAPDGSPNTNPQITLRWLTDIAYQPEQ